MLNKHDFIIIDIEILKNKFILTYQSYGQECVVWELKDTTIANLKSNFNNKVLCGYGDYDKSILNFIIQNPNCSHIDIYNESQRIIKDKEYKIRNSLYTLQIAYHDIMKVHYSSGRTSLKELQILYGLNHQTYDFNKETIDNEQEYQDLIAYNINDVKTTYQIFFEHCWGTIESRYILFEVIEKLPKSKFELLSLLAGSNQFVAEKAFWNGRYISKDLSFTFEFKDSDLPPEFVTHFNEWVYREEEFKASYKDNTMILGDGGAHSVNNSISLWESQGDWVIVDIDIVGQYPNIMINNKQHFKHMDMVAYEKVVRTRQKAIKEGNVALGNHLKLGTNIPYGQLANQHSKLCNVPLQKFVTKYGQYSILTLLKMFDDNLKYDYRLIQTNTDGTTVYINRNDNDILNQVVENWKSKYYFNLKFNIFRKIFIRDVNSYFGIDMSNKKSKRIGIFNKDKNYMKVYPSRTTIDCMVQKILNTNEQIDILPIILKNTKIKRFNLKDKKINKIYLTTKEKGRPLMASTFLTKSQTWNPWKHDYESDNTIPIYYTYNKEDADLSVYKEQSNTFHNECLYKSVRFHELDNPTNIQTKKAQYAQLSNLFGDEYLTFAKLENNKHNIRKEYLDDYENNKIKLLDFKLVGGVKLVPKNLFVILDVDIDVQEYDNHNLSFLHKWSKHTMVIKNKNSQHLKFVFINDLSSEFAHFNLNEYLTKKIEIKQGQKAATIFSFTIKDNISENFYELNDIKAAPMSIFLEDCKIIKKSKLMNMVSRRDEFITKTVTDDVWEALDHYIPKIRGVKFQKPKHNPEKTAAYLEWDRIKRKYKGSNNKMSLYIIEEEYQIKLQPFFFSETGKEIYMDGKIDWIPRLENYLNKECKKDAKRASNYDKYFDKLELFDAHDFQYGNIYNIRTGGKKTLSSINLALKTLRDHKKVIFACNNNENLEKNVFSRIMLLFRQIPELSALDDVELIRKLDSMGIGMHYSQRPLKNIKHYNLIVTNHAYLYEKGDTTEKFALKEIFIENEDYHLIIDELGELNKQFIRAIQLTSLYSPRDHSTIQSYKPVSSDEVKALQHGNSSKKLSTMLEDVRLGNYIKLQMDDLNIKHWNLLDEIQVDRDGKDIVGKDYIDTKPLFIHELLNLKFEEHTNSFIYTNRESKKDYCVDIYEEIYELNIEHEDDFTIWLNDNQKVKYLYRKVIRINDQRFRDLQELLDYVRVNGILKPILAIRNIFEYFLLCVNKDETFNKFSSRICGSTATLNNVHEYLVNFNLVQPELQIAKPIHKLNVRIMNNYINADLKKIFELNPDKKILLCMPTKKEANRIFKSLKLHKFYNGKSKKDTHEVNNKPIYKNVDVSYSLNSAMIGQDWSYYEVMIQSTDILIPLIGRLHNNGIFELEEKARGQITQNIGRVLRSTIDGKQKETCDLYLISSLQEPEKILRKIKIQTLLNDLSDEFIIENDYIFPKYLSLAYGVEYGDFLKEIREIIEGGEYNFINHVITKTKLNMNQLTHIRNKILKT